MNHLIKMVIVLQKLHYNYRISAINNVYVLKLCSPIHDYRLLTVLQLSLPFAFFKKYLVSFCILLCNMHYHVGVEKQAPCAQTGLVCRLVESGMLCVKFPDIMELF